MSSHCRRNTYTHRAHCRVDTERPCRRESDPTEGYDLLRGSFVSKKHMRMKMVCVFFRKVYSFFFFSIFFTLIFNNAARRAHNKSHMCTYIRIITRLRHATTRCGVRLVRGLFKMCTSWWGSETDDILAPFEYPHFERLTNGLTTNFRELLI